MIRPDDIRTPIHPGEVLRHEFLEPMGLTQSQLALDIALPPSRVGQIVRGERAVTADTALRLSRYFGNSAEFWMGLQTQYDLETTQDALAKRIAKEVKPRRRSA